MPIIRRSLPKCAAFLALLAAMVACQRGEAATFHLIPEESFLTVVPNVNGELFATDQTPGSLTTNITGTLEASVTPGFITFDGGSVLDLVEQPGPFLPGNTPADLAGTIEDVLPGLDGYATVRDAVFDVTNGPQPVSGMGEFSTAGMLVFFSSGMTTYEVPGVIDGSFTYGGQFDVFVPKTGLVEDLGGGVFKLTVPFEVSETFDTGIEGLTLTQSITGQIVAVVPEPATLGMMIVGGIGLAVMGRRRSLGMRSR